MKLEDQTCSDRGFTRQDLCALVACCALLGLTLSAVAKTKPRTLQISCANNLRQVGQGWQMYASDHNNRPPWYVDMTENGFIRKV